MYRRARRVLKRIDAQGGVPNPRRFLPPSRKTRNGRRACRTTMTQGAGQPCMGSYLEEAAGTRLVSGTSSSDSSAMMGESG